MKEYRILRADEAANEDKINELARQGFVIFAVVTGSERHGMVLYMEKDVKDADDSKVWTDQNGLVWIDR